MPSDDRSDDDLISRKEWLEAWAKDLTDVPDDSEARLDRLTKLRALHLEISAIVSELRRRA